MASYVIWMDAKEGKIFDMVPGGPKLRHLHTHGNQIHHHVQHGLDPFFKELSNSIKDAKEVLLLGPADTKLHFKAYLEKHFAYTLAKKLLAVETVDHPTDNQLLAHARKFFRAHD